MILFPLRSDLHVDAPPTPVPPKNGRRPATKYYTNYKLWFVFSFINFILIGYYSILDTRPGGTAPLIWVSNIYYHWWRYGWYEYPNQWLMMANWILGSLIIVSVGIGWVFQAYVVLAIALRNVKTPD